MNLIEIAATGAKVKELYELLQIENGDKRWNAVQKWLKQNPEWRERKDKFLSCTPDEGITTLCDYAGIKTSLLPFIDSSGQMRAMVKTAIIQLQVLYREREALDNQNGHQKPAKKAKKKPVKAKPAP